MEGAALAALHSATDDALHDLENLPLARRVMSRDVTLDDYRAYLQAHHAVFAAWSEAYPRCLRRRCRCDPASRLDALHLDLAALGGAVLDERPLGRFVFEWPAESPAWWGALYVFEGTRLDARALARHLRRELGFCVAGALRYLDPINEASSQPAWARTVQSIERALTPEALPEGIEGARAALGHLRGAISAAAPAWLAAA